MIKNTMMNILPSHAELNTLRISKSSIHTTTPSRTSKQSSKKLLNLTTFDSGSLKVLMIKLIIMQTRKLIAATFTEIIRYTTHVVKANVIHNTRNHTMYAIGFHGFDLIPS